jgi:mycofactocin biosynthetic radical S-adenosylmethionine protein MftC
MEKQMFNNSSGFRAIPVLAHWDITYACNFRCSYCLTSSGSKKTNECSTSEAKALIDKLYNAGIIYLRILGGEPFFRKDMIELLDYAVNKGMYVTFSTNGSLITPEKAISLSKMADSLKYVQVSLHGFDDNSYNRVTGTRGNFSHSLQGLKLLVENGLEVSVLVVVTGENVDRIKDYYDLAKQYGAKEVRLCPVAPIGRGSSNEYATNAQFELWEKLVLEASRIKECSYSGGPRLLVQARPLLSNYLKKVANLDTFYQVVMPERKCCS